MEAVATDPGQRLMTPSASNTATPALRFAANLSLLFKERDFLDRFSAARIAGFSAVEFHFPYAFNKASLTEVILTSGVEVILFNLPAGSDADWAAGCRGIACDPDRIAEFREGVQLAIDYATALDCPRLNCLAGTLPPEISREVARRTLVNNLRFAATATRHANITLLIEPLNTRDAPGYLLPTTVEALAMIADVGADNLKLQYDIYHAQVMEGNLAFTLQQHLAQIGHIQLADNPGRHEPGSGEINFPFLLAHLERIGYAGWIGCEYLPSARSEDSFQWLAEWRLAAGER